MGIKFSQLPTGNPLDGTELAALTQVQSGVKKTIQATAAQVAALASAGPLVATLNGSVAGHAYVYQMSNSATNKWYRIILKGWNDAGQTYNWPVAFATFANLLSDTTPPSTLTIAHIVLAASGGVVSAVIDAVGA